MATPRQALNRTVASLVPPIGALVAERDRLRAENSRLEGETDRLTIENDKLATRLSAQETRSDAGDEFYSRLENMKSSGVDRDDPALFAGFVAGLLEHSHGQLFQDVWVLWETHVRRDGFFVEFGVSDGIDLSNTYLLEKSYGWTGVVAEPNPSFHRAVKASRSCFISEKCVYNTSGHKIGFMAIDPAAIAEWDARTLSRIAEIDPDDWAEARNGGPRGHHSRIEVPTISLNDLLIEAEAPSDIDYLSVDTEGSEYEILNHFDFSKWNITCISVEHNFTRNRGKIYELLTSHGYRRKWPALSRWDDWYVKTQ